MQIANNYYEIANISNHLGGLEVLLAAAICIIDYKKGQGLSANNTKYLLVSSCIFFGIDLLSLPLYKGYNKHRDKAIRIYNQGLKQTGMNRINFRIGFTNNSVGINMKF